MKVFTLIALFIISVSCFSNTPGEFESRIEVQKRLNNIDGQKALDTLAALDRLLQRIDNNLDRRLKKKQQTTAEESISDLDLQECEDVPIEELICEQYKWEVDPSLVCYEDDSDEYNIISQ